MASLARGHEDEDDLDGEEWVNPPSPAERCDAAVARGDVLELFNTIRSSEPQLIKHKAEFAKLQSLLESKMQDDLEGSIETVLSQGCALTAYLLLRLRYLVLFQVDAAGFL
ncbi:MAG: hypothetical protein H8E37_01255, partial [Planctomycetes bacterium]|nr:hypothetical protein [Planctomycetota bacterium]